MLHVTVDTSTMFLLMLLWYKYNILPLRVILNKVRLLSAILPAQLSLPLQTILGLRRHIRSHVPMLNFKAQRLVVVVWWYCLLVLATRQPS